MTEWLLTDLHIHTSLSDGALPIEEVLKIYGEAGFDAIAITDHLFDTQCPRGLELYKEGKSIKDLKAYFQRIEELMFRTIENLLRNVLKYGRQGRGIGIAITVYLQLNEGRELKYLLRIRG